MKASELASELTSLIAEHGDREVILQKDNWFIRSVTYIEVTKPEGTLNESMIEEGFRIV